MVYYYFKCDQIDGLMNLIEVLPDHYKYLIE